MAMNGTVKIIAVLLSLTSPIAAHTDYSYRPITRSPGNRPYINDAPSRSRHPNQTFTDLQTRSTNDRHVDDGPIVYPDSTPNLRCTYGLCTNVDNYPAEQIKRLLDKSQLFGYFEATEEHVTVDNRFNSDEMSLCETKVHTIYPEKANNTKKEEKVIVNVEGHKQGIVVETCVNNGACKFSSSFPTGYTSYCKQKFVHKKFMVLEKNGEFAYNSFEVPSCCVCTVSRTD